jgi:trigger factor
MIESKELPELDEEFATRMGAESLEALRSHVRASLQAEDERRANREVEKQILDRLAARLQVEPPARIVNPIADRLFERGVRDLPDLDEGDRERLAVEARQAAVADVRRELVIASVAQTERIEVSQREAEEEYRQLERIERSSGEPRAELTGSQRAERVERLRELLVERKVLKYLVDTADVQVVHQSSTRKRIVTPYDP